MKNYNAFVSHSSFERNGGVITDLDGTAVHEYRGQIVIPKEVELGLMRHYEQGRPIVFNSLRYPLSVRRTFAKEWYRLSNAPIPTVTLNGSLIGFVKKTIKSNSYSRKRLTNFVFAINHIEGQFVIRLSPDPERVNTFEKELWATQKMRKIGVPTPEVLAVGSVR